MGGGAIVEFLIDLRHGWGFLLGWILEELKAEQIGETVSRTVRCLVMPKAKVPGPCHDDCRIRTLVSDLS